MRDKARVIKVLENGNAIIMPLITDACISCTAAVSSGASCHCSSHTRPFTVSNKKKLPIAVGDIVRVKASAGVQSVQAVISLLFPVAFSVFGYFLAGTIASCMGAVSVTEGVRVAGVLVCFVVAVLLVVLISTLVGRSRLAFIDEIESV